MSTQLASPPIKARLKTTQEAAEPSIALPPTPLLPARSKLTKILADYSKAGEDLELYRGKVSRAQADEDMALSSKSLSEEDAAAKISQARSQSDLYAARVSFAEATQANLVKELNLAVNLAHNELSNQVMGVLDKRHEILRDRVIQTARLIGRFSAELDTLLESSEAIQEIRRIAIPSGSLLFCDSAEQIVAMTRKILAGYEAIIAAKMKETI